MLNEEELAAVASIAPFLLSEAKTALASNARYTFTMELQTHLQPGLRIRSPESPDDDPDSPPFPLDLFVGLPLAELRALASAEQTGEGAKRDQDALTAERDGFVRGWQGDVAQKLAEATAKASNARDDLSKGKLRRKLVELRSDIDTIVQSVAKVSVGSVMQSGQQFITLVPTDAPLEVEANISGHDNGFVHTQDPVAIKFDTFPFSQYGIATGTVRIVSPDSFTPQVEARNPTSAVPVTSSAEPFYRSRITIQQVSLHNVPEGFHVIPGMPVTADVKVGKRTVLQYLLGMVLPVAREGMREP